ncbi:5'-nucleotidase C-terminal domain-containing protein [Candidatus Viridilinea mediisalina]|uniref:Multifunctional 2',3'-cyclic-nucleotide 2'-phosphodiesterase/5'-nucleotidase/3'-nucleotidase n=1 Tax=Candidatus Viridilinea mediisalina TaxID=2024553 RepID=A0A2A6RI18_9CHLR|nr:5'-nucleotidase C-terminal domain-containing protein [Candidatus Viridilinea mediisalina]PDW02774.1 multifunctional 2',3'-cyclic-nucleotide 2'-phosphodiesterase/5'-nucleotidase/3'-nucleotidase [Candidatus Viridilinea mediisalina]
MQEKISRRSFLKGSMALGAGAMLWIYADGGYRLSLAQDAPAYKLRILHTNDHHARIEPVMSSGEPVHGGVSRRKTLIDRIRAESPDPVLLVDAGDIFQGTLYFNQFDGQADLEFYNAMGYELMTLGNHEFDRTEEVLAAFITGASFPVLSANITVPEGSALAGTFSPNIVIEKGGERIGFFGLTPQNTPELALGARNLTFSDPVESARAQVAALQAQGVDKIIGLTHIGIELDRRIVREVAGISMIIGGHSHTPMGPMNDVGNPPYPELLPGPDGQQVVIITAWEWGRWLGDVTVSFDAAGRLVDVQGNPSEVEPSLPTDAGFEERIAVFRASLDELRQRVIGESSVELNGERDDIRSRETNLGNLVAEALLTGSRTAGAQIAITNGGGIRTSIPAGPITVGQVLEVLPFGNTLSLVTLSGAQIKEALENGVSQVETGAGRFPQIAGFRFSFDPSQPVGSRISAISYENEALAPDAMLRVVTNNFMLAGGDGYSVFAAGADALDSGLIMSDVVEQYIAANSPITLGTDGRIMEEAVAEAPVVPIAPVPEALPEPLPEAAPEEAPVPIALPTTGGPATPLGLLTSLGLGALAGGLALRRRAERIAAEEQHEQERHDVAAD